MRTDVLVIPGFIGQFSSVHVASMKSARLILFSITPVFITRSYTISINRGLFSIARNMIVWMLPPERAAHGLLFGPLEVKLLNHRHQPDLQRTLIFDSGTH
jgi:hypothetical protein